MDALSLARWQFGITTIYHFIFVPLTMGLVVLVAIMQTFHYRTGNDVYNKMARFWGKLFVIIFTMGVATGIVQEFQFGMNWSEYARFVGDIFGIPLAVEALTAFFLESTFLGLWLFGANRLPKSLHLACIWLVAIGSNLSAFWILAANSWMQVPVGYVLKNGRAELHDLVAIVLNDRVMVQAQHVIASAFTTGGLFVLGISAWHLIRGSRVEMFSRSARIALVFTAVSSLTVATSGHSQAQQTAKEQPMKIAAMEGLWETEQPASFSLFAIHDQANQTSDRELKLPLLLSVLAHNNTTGKVEGMRELQAQAEKKHGPGNYIPNVTVVYWAFRAMVGLGMFFIGISFFGLIEWWRGKLNTSTLYLRACIVALFLPYFSNASGWLVTEMGRQPWVVYGLLKTADGVSPSVAGAGIWVSMTGFTLLYAFLAAVAFYLVHRFARPGSGDDEKEEEEHELAHAY